MTFYILKKNYEEFISCCIKISGQTFHWFMVTREIYFKKTDDYSFFKMINYQIQWLVYQSKRNLKCFWCSVFSKMSEISWIWFPAHEVTSVETDVGAQRVLVTSTLSSDQLLEILEKTGKKVSFVGKKQWKNMNRNSRYIILFSLMYTI